MRFKLILALLLASGCADFKRGEYWDLGETAGEGADDGQYTYAADVHPLLDAGCERCHAPGNSAESTGFLILSDDTEPSYASTLEFVDLERPADSRLLSKMAGDAHGGGVIFDDRSPEYDLTLAWIEQGAAP
jgi:hypothetical protein